jgi:hypothetical protein
MREGRIVAEFDQRTMSDDAVLRAAFAMKTPSEGQSST